MKNIWMVAIVLIALFGCLGNQQPAGPTVPEAPKTKDCGTDQSCFITASKSCELAKISWITVLNLFGVKQTTETYIETKGAEGDKCAVYFETKKVDVILPDSMSEKDKTEVKKAYEQVIGRSGTCKIPPAELGALLERWQQGSFSSEDFKSYSCEGTYFSVTIVKT